MTHNINDLLKEDFPPDDMNLSPQNVKKLFMKYKNLEKELEREKAFWKSTNENLEKAYLELDEKDQELELKNRIMKKNLDMAKRVQKSIINTELMAIHNEFDVSFHYNPMEEVGGDLFDIIRVGKNKFGFLIADVSGHGAPAALISTMAKVFFTVHSHPNMTTGEIVYNINKDMFKFIGDLGYYVSAFYGILDIANNTFQYSNAGHLPAIKVNEDKEICELTNEEGFFIGILKESFWDTKEIEIKVSDKMLLYTDGVVEARNRKEQVYGYERLLKFIDEQNELSPKIFLKELVKDLDKFCAEYPQNDDRALLYFEYKG